jgi:hypothetical protein
MSDATLWLSTMQQKCGGLLTAITGLQAQRDEYEALGGATWVGPIIPPDAEYTAADVDVVMDWLPYLLEGMTPELRAALYKLAPSLAASGGGSVGYLGPGT